ncbi:MAG: PBP1A family penicillin-binding protein [Acidobacteria bacterium]|nr:PBP1A family penicillin-binding protein [Acidobacteriota bacterium]
MTSQKAKGSKAFKLSPVVILLIAVGAVFVLAVGTLIFYFVRFSSLIDERLTGKSLQSESRIFTAPRRIMVGEVISPGQLESYLKAVGYSEAGNSESAGRIVISESSIEIRPSANSFFAGKNALHIDFSNHRIARLRSLDTGNRLISAEIEPELITGLFGIDREKRRPVSYKEFPQDLMKAVLSAEDKRFFDHPGFDPIRILGAAWADLRRGKKAQGASTITMQVARSFFFNTKREWRRKLKETFVALILEHRFEKTKIFELYANEIYLGNRGSFAVHGFGEAAQAYFGKDLRDLNLAQVCFLAGIIRAPNRYSSAERRPERAAEARDRVLASMADNKMISPEQAKEAGTLPLNLVSAALGASLAGHFVDMVKDDLLERFSETELNAGSYRIFTTLDSDLQRAGMEAADKGLKNIDTLLAKTYERWRKKGEAVPSPQVALVALNPHTGEIKALIGGRDYAASQLNHALTRRQPGSVFKPFVVAAAFEDSLEGVEPVLTPISNVMDEPTTFYFDGKEYTPNNYGQEFHGVVTVRESLVRSLNVATVNIAQQVGYGRIVRLARRLGLNSDIKPTPAVALGAYELTPLEVAASYTAFANSGTWCEPAFLQSVISAEGVVIQKNEFHRRRVLDPRVAYLVTNILEDVVNRGTGAGVRSRGFRAPAAGKTGTSHDGWFVGYTSNLLCAVWVGFDDNRQLELSGALSAGPIWAEFMKKAVTLPGFVNMQEFERPEGIVSVVIDPDTHELAVPECPITQEEVFIAGTEPTEPCSLHAPNPIERLSPIRWLRGLFGDRD